MVAGVHFRTRLCLHLGVLAAYWRALTASSREVAWVRGRSHDGGVGGGCSRNLADIPKIPCFS